MKSFLVVVLTLVVAMAASAKIHTEAVSYQDGDTQLEGYLAYDDANSETRPGILVCHEWWGLNDYPKMRAEMLAKLGYIAFCLDMYGKGVVATTPDSAKAHAMALYGDRTMMRRRALEGLKILQDNKLTDPKRIAVIGYCFGGSVALEVARSGADIAGVVTFHGGLSADTTLPDHIKGKVLVLTGADDPNAPPSAVTGFEDEMRKTGADYQIVSYGGAVHAFTNPAAGNDNSKGAAYNEKADKRSWQAMRAFFDEIFQ